MATGYLRSEYRALGIDFEQRNELFDEALEAMRGVWSTDQYSFEGSGYTAKEVSVNPKPGHVPIWIGGNSALHPPSRRRARRRVEPVPRAGVAGEDVAHHPARRARRPRTDARPSAAPHRRPRAATRRRSTSRSPPGSPVPPTTATRAAAHLDGIEAMAALGVTWNSVGMPGDSVDHAIECLERYGAEVIAAAP